MAHTWLFLRPAFVAAVAYIDPGIRDQYPGGLGSVATNSCGSLWPRILRRLIQTQSAKLGLVIGRSLPEHIRDGAPRSVGLLAWVGAEIVAIATDLAELLGAGLGVNLLTGMALFPATIIGAAGTVLLLGLQRRGAQTFEALIAALIAVIGVSYLAETIVAKPSASIRCVPRALMSSPVSSSAAGV